MKTAICCCNHEPPTLRCGACDMGDHESCTDVSMPVRPNPSRPARPLPRDPARKSEKGVSRKVGIALVMAGMFLFCALLVVLVSDEDHEDRRELREFGGMQCVYNVDEDVIEDCTRAPG